MRTEDESFSFSSAWPSCSSPTWPSDQTVLDLRPIAVVYAKSCHSAKTNKKKVPVLSGPPTVLLPTEGLGDEEEEEYLSL